MGFNRGELGFQNTVDIVLWAIEQQEVITGRKVHKRWPVSRATAYRWSKALETARVRAQSMAIPRQPLCQRAIAPSQEEVLR